MESNTNTQHKEGTNVMESNTNTPIAVKFLRVTNTGLSIYAQDQIAWFPPLEAARLEKGGWCERIKPQPPYVAHVRRAVQDF